MIIMWWLKLNSKREYIVTCFLNEGILQLRYKLQGGYLTLLAVYAHEEGKTD